MSAALDSKMSTASRMSALEIRASASLASIFALRMLGLFLILPVFAVYARGLDGGVSPTLIGLAMGIYGLTQGMLQIPMGIASDRFGRKPVIYVGLALFALGSFVAAATDQIGWIIVGRALQGAGAISAAITALIADTTRDAHRTKAMAMVGSSIGLTFAGSLVLAPVLYRWIGMGGIFALTGVLAMVAMGVVRWVVPEAPPAPVGHAVPLREVLVNADLLRLNLGIFVLHLVQMAMFVVVPVLLVDAVHLPLAEHWTIYLPVVVTSFAVMVPLIIAAERGGRMRQVFLLAIALLVATQALLWVAHALWMFVVALLVFFIGFNVLEATLPSLVSRTAPPAAKGAALGVYNTTQAIGLFVGGALGGWLSRQVGPGAVFGMCMALALLWAGVALTMGFPERRTQADAGVR